MSRVWVAAWTLLLLTPAEGQNRRPHRVFDGSDVPTALTYRVVETHELPSDAPIVIAVHGLGDNANGFSFFVRRLRLPFRFVVPDGPHRYRGKGRSWYRIRNPRSDGDVAGSTLRLAELVQHVSQRWPRAPKPFLLGFSQGGVMGYSMAATHPHLLSGVVSIAGYLIPKDLTPGKRRSKLPMLILHGRRDATVKYELGREAEARFRDHGYPVEFYSHNDGHRVPRHVTSKARGWLLRQSERTSGRSFMRLN